MVYVRSCVVYVSVWLLRTTGDAVAIKFQCANEIVSYPPRVLKLESGKDLISQEIELQQAAAHQFVLRIVDSFWAQNFVCQVRRITMVL